MRLEMLRRIVGLYDLADAVRPRRPRRLLRPFVDNLLQLMLIQTLCTAVCGMPVERITGRIRA